MPDVRETGGHSHLRALSDQINALIDDYASGRAGIVAAIRRTGTALLDRQKLSAIIVDLGVLRTPIVALVTDYAAGRAEIVKLVTDLTGLLARFNAGLQVRMPLAALIADLTAIRAQVINLRVDVASLALRLNSAGSPPNIVDGTTKGKLKLNAPATAFKVSGIPYAKAQTDDFWDLTAEVDTDGSHYRAYWLYVDTSGNASVAAGSDATSALLAIGALPAQDGTKCVFGVYVAGLSCDFNGAAGLTAQGTIFQGFGTAYSRISSDPAALTTSTSLGIANGSTAGKLKTQADSEYAIAGARYRKAATDDLWDLSAEVDTLAGKYRAYWLYVNVGGTASIVASATDEDSEALAIAALPALDAAKAVLGVFVAGPSCDFNAGGGLSGQGTLYNGYPAALAKTAAAPAAVTAASPAALTTDTTLGIGNGGTAGRLRTNGDTEFMIDGIVYRKAATDDLWDLSAEVDTLAGKYRAYWLYLDAAGAASIAAGPNATSEALAIAALPAETATKCPVGVYVAGPSTNFANALASQGTLYNGRAAAVADPAAVTAEAITIVGA